MAKIKRHDITAEIDQELVAAGDSPLPASFTVEEDSSGVYLFHGEQVANFGKYCTAFAIAQAAQEHLRQYHPVDASVPGMA